MPIIAEIKEIDGRVWVKLEPFTSASGVIYIWTEEEKIAHDQAVIEAYKLEMELANGQSR